MKPSDGASIDVPDHVATALYQEGLCRNCESVHFIKRGRVKRPTSLGRVRDRGPRRISESETTCGGATIKSARGPSDFARGKRLDG